MNQCLAQSLNMTPKRRVRHLRPLDEAVLCYAAFVLLAIMSNGTCGLVAMTSASHAEGRQFDPGQVYTYLSNVAVERPHRQRITQLRLGDVRHFSAPSACVLCDHGSLDRVQRRPAARA